MSAAPIIAPTGVRMTFEEAAKLDPDTWRGPDVAVVRAERVPTGKGVAGWLGGAPDLAVEVVGDGQTVTGMLKKAAEYLRAGAKAVWVVDPDPAQVAVITADGLTVLGSDDTIEGGDALPGFACTVSEFFA